jgi:hypothetical protein
MTADRPSRVDYWRRQPPMVAGVLMALAAAAFAIVSNSTRTGDVAYHLSILATLLIILGLLLVPGRSDGRPA